jgi:uncharacterized metal-binding protein YceD (DUF177 family)
METQNITLSLPKDVLLKVKHIAVRRHTSISSLLTQALETLVQRLLERVESTGETDAVVLDARIRPLDLVEDELLLALPLVPVHPDGTKCEDTGGWILQGSD